MSAVKLKAVPGERRECSCLTVRHVHGTVRTYKADRCRCRPCTDAAAVYQRKVAKARALRESAMQAAVTADLERLDRERLARAGSYSLTAESDRETRARALLAAGLHPGRVAEMTGMAMGAVDRLAGVAPKLRAGDASVPSVSRRSRVRKSA